MQEKDVEYTDKNGKVRVRKGCSLIRECVVVINEDMRIKALLRFTRMVEARWGIKALQVHLHRDEGIFSTIRICASDGRKSISIGAQRFGI